MRILLVDNGTSYLPQLQALLGGAATVVPYSGLAGLDVEAFGAVVLSGGHAFPVVGNEARLESELALIRQAARPVFGICYGFELIATAFGGKLELMQNKEQGVLEIEVLEREGIFDGVEDFRVFESHRWVVRDAGSELVPLARSRDGIEAVRHRSLPVYGVQFHPEMLVDQTGGHAALQNFLRMTEQSATMKS